MIKKIICMDCCRWMDMLGSVGVGGRSGACDHVIVPLSAKAREGRIEEELRHSNWA
jgi:hypothetical protein